MVDGPLSFLLRNGAGTPAYLGNALLGVINSHLLIDRLSHIIDTSGHFWRDGPRGARQPQPHLDEGCCCGELLRAAIGQRMNRLGDTDAEWNELL